MAVVLAGYLGVFSVLVSLFLIMGRIGGDVYKRQALGGARISGGVGRVGRRLGAHVAHGLSLIHI